MELTIRAPLSSYEVVAWIGERWGGEEMAVHGRLYNLGSLDALVATTGDKPVGILTYIIEDDALEIVSCDANPPGCGVGGALVGAVVDLARRRSLNRLWATTTNDNLAALGFWQSVGFRLRALRPDAVKEARLLKAAIPERGYQGLVIRDEIDLEMILGADKDSELTRSQQAQAQAQAPARTMSFGYDGDGGLGDRLVEAVLSGAKTATSSLAVEYLSGEPLPRVGERLPLVDSTGRCWGTVETTRVRIIALSEVGDDVAHNEGEGFSDAQEWREAREAFWKQITELIQTDAGDPNWQLCDNEPVVIEWFRLLDTTSR